MRAFRALTGISLGLADGRILNLRAGDVIPPSWAAVNGHMTGDWLKSATVVIADVDPAVLEQADRAAESRAPTPRTAGTVADAAQP